MTAKERLEKKVTEQQNNNNVIELSKAIGYCGVRINPEINAINEKIKVITTFFDSRSDMAIERIGIQHASLDFARITLELQIDSAKSDKE